MTRVLVTGGGGQLGREFALQLGADAVALGRAELDVADEQSVERAFAQHRPELVLHCAAWTDVDGAESDPDGAWRANEHGSRHVARAARARGAALVGFSTDYVFAGDDPAGYDEGSPVGPRSVYGASKLAGERALLREHPEAYLVRTAWVFSPRGSNFVLTMLRLGAERDELAVVDDQVGCPTAASHLVRATLQLVERCAPGTYHLAGGGSTSWYGFARAIMEEAGLNARIEPISSSELQRPAPRPASSILRTVRPDAPRLPHWRDGLRDCLAALANAEGT
ncbi:MAG TPA: dTDP-4-dehydrorhamnose reductase [Gaiellales bacterium]|jgi:dTDP-4-dehydrorhamnose reductase|nr:dTDP-4-dehydrorhamnose reductase [Gaiellales bacterium]